MSYKTSLWCDKILLVDDLKNKAVCLSNPNTGHQKQKKQNVKEDIDYSLNHSEDGLSSQCLKKCNVKGSVHDYTPGTIIVSQVISRGKGARKMPVLPNPKHTLRKMSFIQVKASTLIKLFSQVITRFKIGKPSSKMDFPVLNKKF